MAMVKIFIALWMVFIGAYCAPTIEQKLNDGWIQFKQHHGRNYKSTAEETTRRAIWQNNVAIIKQHNLEAKKGLHTYTLGVNQFTDLTNAEFRQKTLGFEPSTKLKSTTQYKLAASVTQALPTAVDWRQQGYVTPVKDQAQCSAGWAFSATGALEGQWYNKTKRLVPLSEQNLVDCSGRSGNLGCNGGQITFAFDYIKANGGIDTGSSYLYEGRVAGCRYAKANIGANITGYVQLPSGNEPALQLALATVGPVAVAIDSSDSAFQFYRQGIYQSSKCSASKPDLGVLAVGYGEVNGQQYYIVKNSWGTSWGNQGYILMARNASNQCGIATTASYPLV